MKYLTVFLFCLIIQFVSGQDNNELENNLDLQDRTEALENNNWNFSEYPKDINLITEEELEYLNILSHSQIESFLRYRRFVHRIYSIYELLDIPGYDTHTFSKISLYIKSSFSPRTETREYLIIQSSRFLNTTDSPFEAYQRNHYQLRFRKLISPRISVGLSLDSDIGESINFNNQRGTNHSVGYIKIKKTFSLDKIIIGNFSNHYGQGLMFSNQFFNGKSSKSIFNSYFNSDETTPYQSMGESGYLRGVSVYKRFNNLKMYAWVSSVNLSGSITNDTLTSIYNTGYYRTNKEYLKLNVAQENAIGGRLSYKFLHNKLKLGISCSKFMYSTPIQLYYMRRSNVDFVNLGLDYLYRTKHFSLFGELVNQNKTITQIHGLQTNIDDNTRFSVIYRNYHHEYFNLRANGFSSFSNNRNEEGLYLSINHKLNRVIEFFAYIDRFRHKTPSYGQSLATKNTSWILGSNFLLKPKQKILIAYKQDHNEIEIIENKLPQKSENLFNHFFISHKTQINKTFITNNLQLKTNLENESINFGQYFSHKLEKVQFTFGYNIFDAINYDVRLYQYQPDLTFNNSFNLLTGKGSQFFSIVKIKLIKNLTFSTKVILTTYSDKKIILKGLETIKDNKVWEAKIQLFYAL